MRLRVEVGVGDARAMPHPHRQHLSDAGLAVLALVVGVGAALVLHGSNVSAVPASTPAPLVSTTATPTARPTAIVVGDSYFWPLPGNGPSVGVRVANALGWDAVQSTIGGTGYIKKGYDGTSSTYGQRLARFAGQRPAVILIEGGGNDETFGANATGQAALSTFQQVRHDFPAARLIVIGPLWSGDRGPLGQAMTDAVHRVAVTVGAGWVDPTGWFPGTFYATSGPGREYIGPDRVHENQAGTALLTAKAVAAVRAVR